MKIASLPARAVTGTGAAMSSEEEPTHGHWIVERCPRALRRFLRRRPMWLVEVVLFLAVGGAQLTLDWIVYVVLSYGTLPVAVANIIARMSGASLGFWLNRKVTFPGADGRVGRSHFLRFSAFWVVATFFSTAILEAARWHYGLEASWLVKPAIEAVLAVASYLISKYWIYR